MKEPGAEKKTKQAEAANGEIERRLGDPEFFINRELSLLEFQRRVLDEARDESNPLLERVKFLAIVGSNLNEFFMVRMAGLKQQHDAGVVKLPPDGMTPAEQLAAARKVAAELLAECRICWRKQLLPALKKEGIQLLDYDQLNEKQARNAEQYFDERVFPVLTPLAFDPGRPFPHISNLSLNLAILIRDPDGQERFARIKVPGTLPRLVPLKRSSGGARKDGTVPHKHSFVWLDQVIAANLRKLFSGMEIVEAHPFRVVRDADPEIQELEASDLLETIEDYVRRRHFGQVVMLSLPTGMPERIREILVRNLGVDPKDAYLLQEPLGLSDTMSVTSIDRHDLKNPLFLPATPPRLESTDEDGPDIFTSIRKHDILLHHPYDSFTPVLEFLRTAARDPRVLAIKQTLYRVGRDSPVVETLLEARANGKEVAVLVELKARFDESSNIEWARALEREGVHVIYGLLGLKTHSKIALVVREERGAIRRYVHLATGNYNPVTAHLYTDIGMFTCDPDIGADATELFNYLTGYSSSTSFRKLLVAPFHLRDRLRELVHREIEHQKAGRGGHLVFKMNSLVDKRLIKLLYGASQAGVRVDLIVRGICCLRPGIPGVSENIRVISIVGRFLEHSRAYWFANGGKPEVYLGSADIMPRNLDHRVEVIFPVRDPALVEYLREDVLDVQLRDNVKARVMESDGTYRRAKRPDDAEPVNAQAELMASRRAARR